MISAVKPADPTPQEAINGARKPLLGITKGRITAPPRILCYGPEGVGKSTLGSKAENPIFLCREAGTEQLPVDRLPEATMWRDAPPDSDGIKRDVISLTDSLRFGEHDYRTLVVDTLDWLEPLLFQYICHSGPKKVESIVLAYGGYGKGYEVAINEWRSWLAQLDALRRERGMTILLLAHSHIKSFNNPEGENYDRYQLKMNEKGAGILKEWSDAVLFAHQMVHAAGKETHEKKKFGVSDQVRYLFTQRRPAWDAKNRFGLPEQMPLSWPDLMGSIRIKSPQNVDALVAHAKEAAALLNGENQKDALAAVDRAGRDPEKLAILINWIQSQAT